MSGQEKKIVVDGFGLSAQKEITIDIDVRMQPCEFLVYAADCRFILSTVGNLHLVEKGKTRIWDTRRGHHIRIHLSQSIANEDCVTFQLLLGSDRKREAFNFRRMMQGRFRSYLFDAKITKAGSFVNEVNQMFEDVWESVFSLSEKDFEERYLLFQKQKHQKEAKKNAH